MPGCCGSAAVGSRPYLGSEGGLLKAAVCLVHRQGRVTLRSDHQKQSPAYEVRSVDVCQFSYYITPDTMITQVIESRYTVDYDVLVAFLSSIFGSSPCEIDVRMCFPEQKQQALLIDPRQVPDEGEKWKVQVPRELTRVSVFGDRSRVTVPLT
jgi:hypothetical protein